MKAGYIVHGPLCVLAETWSSAELRTHKNSGYGQAISSFLGSVLLKSKLESVHEYDVIQLLLDDDFTVSDLKELITNKIKDNQVVFVYIPYLRKKEIGQFNSADAYWEHIMSIVEKYVAAGFVNITSIKATGQGEQDYIWLVYDSPIADTLVSLNSYKEIMRKTQQSGDLNVNDIPKSVYSLYGGVT